ncbi:MAG: cation transporter [Desulfurococcales archaeon]|nr:cation transporter [Desulfurococcales archaeon]
MGEERIERKTRWIPYRPGRGPAVRKILKVVEATRLVYRVSAISLLLAVLGVTLYVYVYPSNIILFEAFVWMIEAISFTGIAVALKIASSRTQLYGARYEILRIEALAALIVSVIALIITGFIVYKSLVKPGGYTPLVLSSYPLLSAFISYLLEKSLHRELGDLEIKITSLKVVADKLGYDVLIELAGGIAIILSNIIESSIIEKMIVIVTAIYVSYGLLGISNNNLLYLIGPGPSHHRAEIRRKIIRELNQAGYKPRRIRVEVYGTFAEAEVWIELDSSISLSRAHNEAVNIAKRLVHNIPELLRVLVITVPTKKRKIYLKRGSEKANKGTLSSSKTQRKQ